MITVEARVVRGGRERKLPSSDLVPGDVVGVQPEDTRPSRDPRRGRGAGPARRPPPGVWHAPADRRGPQRPSAAGGSDLPGPPGPGRPAAPRSPHLGARVPAGRNCRQDDHERSRHDGRGNCCPRRADGGRCSGDRHRRAARAVPGSASGGARSIDRCLRPRFRRADLLQRRTGAGEFRFGPASSLSGRPAVAAEWASKET